MTDRAGMPATMTMGSHLFHKGIGMSDLSVQFSDNIWFKQSYLGRSKVHMCCIDSWGQVQLGLLIKGRCGCATADPVIILSA